MNYYGLLMLVLSCLVASVIVQGQNLFASEFFSVAYAVMALAMVIGSKFGEGEKIDFLLGWLIICSVGFMSTQVLIEMLTNKFIETFVFKIAIIVALDYAALSFLRLGMQIRGHMRVVGDGRYAIQ